jgi:hypothetical protein
MISTSAELDYEKVESQLKTLLAYRRNAARDYISVLDSDKPNPKAKEKLKEIIEYANINIKQLLGL